MFPSPRTRRLPMLALVPCLLLGLAGPALARSKMAVPKVPAVASTLDITVLGTTDVHGHIYPTNYFRDQGNEPFGLARAYTLIRQIRAATPHTLLVDSGDSLQGTPLTYHSARVDTRAPNPMVAAYNYMRYDAFAMGNHEYNYGIPYIEKARREARYPFMSANIYRPGTHDPIYTPYVIKQVGDAKVGIVAFTTPGIAVWDRRFVKGQQDFGDIEAAARRYVPELKARGADAIVVIIHSGLGAPYDETFEGYSASEGVPAENVCAKLADTIPGIDAIMLGHSHKNLPQLVRNGVVLTQAKKWADHLARVDLKLAKQPNGRYRVVSRHATTLDTARIAPDAGLMAVTQQAHRATLAYVNSEIGRSLGEWTAKTARVADSPIMDFINEVQAAKTGAQLSAASVFNGEARLPKGKVTVADLASLYVYENTLAKIELTGRQLHDYLENSAAYFLPYKRGGAIFNDTIPPYNYDMVSGVTYQIDVTRPIGQRITRLDYRGKPVTPDQTFTMALNSYRQNGGGGYTMIKTAPVKQAIYTGIRDLLIDYVKEKKVIDPRAYHTSWKIVPDGVVGSDGEHYR